MWTEFESEACCQSITNVASFSTQQMREHSWVCQANVIRKQGCAGVRIRFWILSFYIPSFPVLAEVEGFCSLGWRLPLWLFHPGNCRATALLFEDFWNARCLEAAIMMRQLCSVRWSALHICRRGRVARHRRIANWVAGEKCHRGHGNTPLIVQREIFSGKCSIPAPTS